MPHLDLDDGNRLFYLHTRPNHRDGRTFVFFNALTGDTGMWEGAVGAPLRAAGHGTLSFNFRGQPDSPFDAEMDLNETVAIDDARRLLTLLQPHKPVLVGLSIGGLFAAKAWLAGIPGPDVEGLVLINTLRRDGPGLRWINDALVRCTEVGGLQLFRDLFLPVLCNRQWLAEHRDEFLKDAPYAPLAPNSGHANLLRNARTTDWDLPYEDLILPVLVITGLQDRLFLDRDDVDTLFARLPRARRIDMPDAAHLLPAERPEALVTALLQFAGEP